MQFDMRFLTALGLARIQSFSANTGMHVLYRSNKYTLDQAALD